jgi:hypothetical protein
VLVSLYYDIVLAGKMPCKISIYGTENLNVFIYYPTCLSSIVSLTHPVDKYSVSVGAGSKPTRPVTHHVLLSLCLGAAS